MAKCSDEFIPEDNKKQWLDVDLGPAAAPSSASASGPDAHTTSATGKSQLERPSGDKNSTADTFAQLPDWKERSYLSDGQKANINGLNLHAGSCGSPSRSVGPRVLGPSSSVWAQVAAFEEASHGLQELRERWARRRK